MLRLGLSLLLLGWALAVQSTELDDALNNLQADHVALALPVLRTLAGQGNAVAQFHLGELYKRGRGVDTDLAQAAQYFRLAAEAGYRPAQLALAELYDAGLSVVQDSDMAGRWFEKAAASGDAQAQLQLGLHYIRLNTPEGFSLALPVLQAAAQQGQRDAQYFLARLYLEGRGLDPDRAQAMLWLGRASAQGQIAAQRFLYLLKQADVPESALDLRDLRRQLAAGEAQLESIASDARYGYDKTLPIKTGLGFEAEWRYLNALRGPHGEVVHYQRLGICCAFASAQAESGKGFLDRYRLRYDGQAQPVLVYLNMFEEASLQAPVGFTFAGKHDE